MCGCGLAEIHGLEAVANLCNQLMFSMQRRQLKKTLIGVMWLVAQSISESENEMKK
jgi:hypothetical protein